MKKEDIAQLVKSGLDELNQSLAEGNSDRLERLLSVMAKFPRYSFNNCLLIQQQRPDATIVQGFHGWKRLGRSVKKGEKGIGITAPMAFRDAEKENSDHRVIRGFRVVHVFDVEQTEGEPLPTFAEPHGDPGIWVDQTEILILSKGIELAYERLGVGVYGYSAKGKIVIQFGLEPAKRLGVLIHELAHELLHADERFPGPRSHQRRETEAEAVSHVVCRSLGMECLEHSTDYIHLHNGDSGMLTESMQRIQKCASGILQELTAMETEDVSEALVCQNG